MNLVDNPGHLVEIPRKKKALLKFFGANSNEISKFIKTQKLKIDSEEDLIKILNFYFK